MDTEGVPRNCIHEIRVVACVLMYIILRAPL